MSASSSSSSWQRQRSSGDGGGRRRRRPPTLGSTSNNGGVWPEPFLEALATQVAIEASRDTGRLAAAPALANLFQVCSTWRAISRSDRLWRRLTRRIWTLLDRPIRDTWFEEYIYRHRTVSNFRAATYTHTILQFDASDDPAAVLCSSLALSETHLAAGFGDGSVRLFLLGDNRHTRTLYPRQRDLLGPFSRAVSGIILSPDRLVFASLDGDVQVSSVDSSGGPIPRLAVSGDVFTDGVLVDFAGSNGWWVGLYAGVPDRAFRVWDARSEEPVYVGGTLTNPEAVPGWHLLNGPIEFVGRVRAATMHSIVACTRHWLVTCDVTNEGVVVREEEEYPGGLVVSSVDASNGAYVVLDSRWEASVRRDGVEVCRFGLVGRAALRRRGVVPIGCMNGGYVVMCAGGAIRVWDWEVEPGQYLYRMRERVEAPSDMVANDRYVAASGNDTLVHLWDFGPQ